MAMSLEDLLAKEGFKGRSSKKMNRASSGPVTSRIHIHPVRDDHVSGAAARLRKTERAYSDARRYDKRVESPVNDSVKSRTSVDILKREKLDRGSRNETNERRIRRGSRDMNSIESSKEGKDGVIDKGRYKDIYLNGVFSPPISKNEQYNETKGSYNHWKNGNEPGSSSSISNRSTQTKENDQIHIRRLVEIEPVAELALDEIATKAIISILSGYIKSFIKNRDFRTSLYHNCFSTLNFSKLEDEIVAESKVISNLDQAIETVERAVENHADAKELKKASLQLSVITGLNANDLKDGFTSGVPNAVLSACAHLYLSVIYQLQKKERIAAKHLLQAFSESPFSARVTLVPELWETVFRPHLSHLEVWYDEETRSLSEDPRNTRKIKELKKVYSEILDMGTLQFAVYYKDWLTDGVEAPSVPSIPIPSGSVSRVRHESLDFGSSSPFSPKPMVSKKLYESVFGQIQRPVTAEAEDYQYSQRSDDDIRSSLEEDEYKDLDVISEEDRTVAEEDTELQQGLKNTNMLQSLPVAKINELTLKRLAKSVFLLKDPERSVDRNAVLHEKYADRGGNFFLNIPEDYVCPLTGALFEDPVTLETGQTYECEAITEWFHKGKKICPVTGKTLKCQTVPFTNSILKRIINSWKSKHSRDLLASVSQPAGSPGEHKYKDETTVFILEQLLTVFGKEENAENTKKLIALGGLQFLIRRFGCGNLDEKTRVAALLSRCIKADSGCWNLVAREIEKQSLLELLHCKTEKSRSNAVFLLFDLICINRRTEVRIFLSGLHEEGIASSMHILLLFLQSCSPEERPLVAVLLLHLDLMVDQEKYSVYREEAVDTIISALDSSLSNEKVRETCCRALLVLGGRISVSGKVMTEDWILKKAGFLDSPESDIQEDKIAIKDNIFMDGDEEEAVEHWLIKLTACLLADGKKSFLDSLSRCMGSGHQDMTLVGLTTVAWLSSALLSLPDCGSQLSVFSILVSKLKENLRKGQRVEHKILAAMSLLHFSEIPDCKNLLMTIADEIAVPLKNLSDENKIAKELLAIISQEDL